MQGLKSILIADQNALIQKEEAFKEHDKIIEDKKNEALKVVDNLNKNLKDEIKKITDENQKNLLILLKKHESNMNEIKEKILKSSKNKNDVCLKTIIDKVVNS